MGIVLNKGQEQVCQEAINWFLNSPEQIFEISAEAGCGKTVVLWEIVRRLRLQPHEYMPMAYTGQAAIVLRTKGFENAKSIHSWLYKFVKVPAETYATNFDDPFKPRGMNTEFNTPRMEHKFVPLNKGEISPYIKLMIIDEGYMVPLNMKSTILKHGIKVLVAGDDGQLPPIGDKAAFLTGYGIHRLTELMRQSEDDPIVYLARRARHGKPIHCGLYGSNVAVIDENDFTDNMLVNVGNVICGTNKTRDYLNTKIRSKLLNSDYPYPVFGDRIICRANNWNMVQNNIALANGLQGNIISPITVDNFHMNTETFRLDFLPDLLSTPFKGVNVNFKYLISPYDIRNDIKSMKFVKGELFEYAYAITTHLSQGAEYNSGIFYEEFLRPNIQNALVYTGITRFKKYMIYVKPSRRVY